MGKPEGATTRVLRSTMDLELDAVNAKLIEAGESPVDAITLAKRRSWIRTRGVKKNSRKVQKSGRRKSPPPTIEPRPGSFAHFVWNQPYDMPPRQLLERARAARITTGNVAQVYKIRAQYPKDKSTQTKAQLKANQTAAVLPPRPARDLSRPLEEQAISKALMLNPRENNLSARSLFVLMVLRIGLDDAKAIMRDFEGAHERLEESLKNKM